MGEFCSFPPMTLNPKPSSVLGSSTTLGWAWPSEAAKAATVALAVADALQQIRVISSLVRCYCLVSSGSNVLTVIVRRKWDH